MSTPNFATPATKYASNPIIARAALTGWYSNQLFDFQAMIDPANSSQILIFCSGLTTGNVISIGLFTAPTSNPYAWTHIAQVLQGSGSGFDSAGVRLGSVIYDAGTFYMFYTGYATSYTANYFSGTIGVATSTDHLTFGSRAQIVTAAGNGRNDGSGLDCFAVIKKPDTTWAAVYAYYIDADPNELPAFRAATASTPTGTWTKAGSGDIYGGDSVGTKFYEFHQLLYVAPTYYLLYEQGGSVASNIPYQCYAASSSDPTTTFAALNSGTPIIPHGAAASWDQYHTATPGVLTQGNGDPIAIAGAFYGYYCGAGDVLEAYYSNEWPPAMVTLAATSTGRFGSVFAGAVR